MSRPSQKQPAPQAGVPPADYAAWRRSVEKSLGDDAFEDALISRVQGGFEVEPVYTARSRPVDFDWHALPGQPPFTRGYRAADADWRIAQEVAHPWAVEAAEAMCADQDRGVHLLWLRMGGIVSPGVWDLEAATDYDGIRVTSVDDVEKLITAVDADTEVVLESGEEAMATAAMWIAAAHRRGLDVRQFTGNFGGDPLADLSTNGLLRGSLSGAFRQLSELAAWTLEQAPRMRSTMVSATPYHDAGATAVQELAFAISTGVCYLRQISSGGVALDAAASQLDFSFSIGRDFFLEIAKLRAARLLWSKVVCAAGVGEQARLMRIHARTSALETARVGPWMNLVRGGAQSFAAALGGADSIRTSPWDEALGWPDDRSRRLAVNVQHVLAEEARLGRVVDTAGGSWYLESLTDRLARRAWELFQELESHGGMARCVTSGLVAERVSAAAVEQRQAAAKRAIPLIGANAFVDLAEAPYAPKLPRRVELPQPTYDLAEESDSISIQELLNLEDMKFEREIGEIKQIDALLVAVELSMEAPGVPGELMELSIDASSAGARGEQVLEALVRGQTGTSCDESEPFRLARPFERLRASSDRWLESRGRRPQILLLRLEPEDRSRAASDQQAFARRLFAVAGVKSIEGEAVTAVESGAEHFGASEAEAAVILAEDALHVEIAELAGRLKQLGASAVFVAGRPGGHEGAFRDAGVDGFVYDGCDLHALLKMLHESLQAEEWG